MTNKQMTEEKWVYVPSPTENFQNKEKGHYYRKNEDLLFIERYKGQIASYDHKDQLDAAWSNLTDGPDEQDSN